ncbi:insulinase family protein [Gillisia sp. M10.2A]|uniref:Insulinase family protein n=1 Tax=Gillisia lutea TaxID=2909668 RepID=A0ABS9EGB5_9FLAO|nr:pitrilysin family protein [Gillisia lutea]MCF4100443.1 insulinase family protein [Gillisia lutea]
MKNKLTALAVVFLMSFGIQAQVDRTKQPEAGPAPKINLGTPETFKLDNGMKVLLVENHKLPRVNMTLTLDNPPHPEGTKAGVSSLLGDLLGSGSQNIEKDAFNEEIDYLGANVNFFSSGASANTLSKYFPRILELMAEGTLNPNFTQEEFEKSKDRTLEGLKADEKNVAANARKLRSALAYGKNHPYGEMETKESIEALTLENVKNTYNDYFVPQNAYLVIVGDVTLEEVKPMVTKLFGNWKKKDLPSFTIPQPSNVQFTQVNFMDMPNAVQSEVAVVNTIQLKKGDKDYFPVLVANQILGGGGEGRLFLNLREDKGYTYGAYSSTSDDKYVSTFVVSASVRNAVTDSAVVAFLDEIHRIRNEKVSTEELNNAKSKYVGNFVMALEQPTTIARYALNIETDDLPKDFYQNYLKKINAVTAEDVQRVAKKYFMVDKARIVVTGKGSEVAAALENLSYNEKAIPVKYFDRFANSIDKPEFNKAVDKSVTVESVFNKYLKAIGGKETVSTVESVMMLAQAEIQGQKLDLEVKNTASGKSATVIAMGGNPISKQIFNGESGFVVAQGQKVEFTEEQIVAAKASANPFPELEPNGAKIMGVEAVEGKDAYAVALTDDTTNYYDLESGLKVKSVKTVSQGGQTMSIPTGFSNYQEVSGIKFPFTISQSFGPQSFEFNVTSVKVNEGVSDSDFEE